LSKIDLTDSNRALRKQSCGLLLARGPQGRVQHGEPKVAVHGVHGRHFHCRKLDLTDSNRALRKQSCGLLLARGPQGESNTGSQRLPSMVCMGGIFIVENRLNGLEQGVKKTVLWTIVSPRPARASPTRGAKECRPWLCMGGFSAFNDSVINH
jgi:hypothetical protein